MPSGADDDAVVETKGGGGGDSAMTMLAASDVNESEKRELLRLREHQKRRGENGNGGSYAGASGSRCHEPEVMSAYKHRKWALFSIIGGLIYGYNVRCAMHDARLCV